MSLASKYFQSRVASSGAGSNIQVLEWGNNTVANSTVLRHLDQGVKDGLGPNNLSSSEIPAIKTGTLKNLRVRHAQGAGNGNNVDYELIVNGAATGITVSVASTSTALAIDAVNTFAVSANDLVGLQVSKAAGIGSSPVDIYASAEIE